MHSRWLDTHVELQPFELKKKLLEKPLTDTAAVTEEGPGIGNIFIFFLTHSSTISLPGSDNAGVPASDTNETI